MLKKYFVFSVCFLVSFKMRHFTTVIDVLGMCIIYFFVSVTICDKWLTNWHVMDICMSTITLKISYFSFVFKILKVKTPCDFMKYYRMNEIALFCSLNEALLHSGRMDKKNYSLHYWRAPRVLSGVKKSDFFTNKTVEFLCWPKIAENLKKNDICF